MKVTSVRPGGALLAAALILACSSSSEAGWGHHRGGSSGGGSYGSSGASYGSSGYLSYSSSGGSSGYTAAYASSGGSSGYTSHGSSGYASGGSSGRVSLVERFKAHMAAKHARHAARRASHGSSGYASSGGSSGYSSYSSSGGSSGYSSYSSHGSSGYVPAVSYGSSGTAGVYHGASKVPTGTAAGLVSNVRGDAVYLTVTVPSNAKIFVNDNPTTSTGSVRQFVSRGLQEGKSYKFVVRAELESADGEVMVEEKELKVSAGEREDIRFAFADYDASIETALTLNVPEGAEVTLAGNVTKAKGESRVYRTSRLKAGEVWDDYEVEVRVGEQVKRRTVRLIGGDQLQLTFAFDEAEADKLASR